MKKINILSDETIIKIAAGEVIENPASIVKELVENSIDAGSDKIIIELLGNGSSLVKITDNGVGMTKEDLDIAFKRHTTSKIAEIHDLENTLTLGFRGEALSSVAAVSKVEVVTKTRDNLTGYHGIIDDRGNIESLNEIVTNKGTSISCKDLFYNMPVRKNYLETKNFEINKTNDIINRLILSNPNISFDYIKDQELIIKTNKNRDLLSNIYSVLGNNIGNNLIEISYSDEIVSFHGYISNNLLFRGNRNSQFLFINKRTIFNSELISQIEKSYTSIIPLNRFPVFVIYVDIDPKYLDVNIHPKKNLIKVLETVELENKLGAAAKKSLESHIKVPTFSSKPTSKNESIFESYDFADLALSKKSEDIDNVENFENFEQKSETLVEVKDYSEEYKPITNNYFSETKAPKEEIKLKEKNNLFPNGYRYIGNLFLQYILIEDNIDKVLYVLDQHAIHERINYEKLVSAYKSGNISTQTLISGYTVELNRNNFNSVMKMKEDLLSIGIEIEEFGESTVLIRSIPVYLDSISPEKLIIDLIESENKIENLYEFDPYKVMRLACKSSIKSGKYLSQLEVNTLIEDLKRCEQPLSCPHGRPTMIKITNNWLEKEFFRIQI